MTYDKMFKSILTSIEARKYLVDIISGITGIEKGIEQGEENKQIEIASKMKSKSMSLQDIIDITGLSKEEIEKL